MNQITDVPHPGYFIREELEAREWTQRDLAFVLGVPEQAINMIISGKRGISADMAKALAGAFDVPAEFFANLQKAYDLSRARDPDPSVSRKARLQSIYPVREMIKRGWLTDSNAVLLEAQLARFFGVVSVDDIPHLAHVAKKTNYSEDASPAQLAWLFRVRQIAKEIPVKPYSEKRFRDNLPYLRRLMIDPDETRHVPQMLLEYGVRCIFVESLVSSAKIDGACFWLGKSPVIGMTLRYDRIDNFWFVLWHEIQHILEKHGQETDIIDAELDGKNGMTEGDIPAEELIANRGATDSCISMAEMKSFIQRKHPFISEKDVLGFAKRVQVHPGIAAGQLRRQLNRWDLFSRMLVKVRYAAISAATIDGWGQIAPVSG